MTQMKAGTEIISPLEGEVLDKNYTTTIAEYSPTAAALKALSEKYKGKTYEVTTTAGMTEATVARREIRSIRVALENKRVEIKAPALQLARDIDSEAKRITKALEELEIPIDAQIKAEEARKEQIKHEAAEKERIRVQSLQDAIQKLRDLPLLASGKTAVEVADIISSAKTIVIGDEYQELQLAAQTARETSIRALELLYTDALTRDAKSEEVKAEIARLETLRAEQEERDRKTEEEKKRVGSIQVKLDRLKTAYVDVVGGTSQAIFELLDRYQKVVIGDEYQEFADEAKAHVASGIEKLTRMHADAVEREGQAGSAAAEKERIAGIQEKLNVLRNRYVSLVGQPSSVIAQAKKDAAATDTSAPIFQEFSDEAFQLKQTAIVNLEALYTDAVKREEREAKEKSDKEEAERLDRERVAKQAEDDRKKAQEETEKREAAELERQAADRKLKLSEAKRESAEAALGEIFTLATSEYSSPNILSDRMRQIALIAEANLTPKVPGIKKVRKSRNSTIKGA